MHSVWGGEGGGGYSHLVLKKVLHLKTENMHLVSKYFLLQN